MKGYYPVWASITDVGGMNGVLPVVDFIEKETGTPVLLIVNGRAAELLKGCRDFVSAPAETLLEEFAPPKVLITSMCGESIGRTLVPHLRGRSAIVAAQDYWGGQLWLEWADPKYRPDYIWVNDDVGKAMVLEAWPGFSPDNVLVTGFPAFDKYAFMDVEGEARKVQEVLGLSPHVPLVLFGGQAAGTGATLAEVVDVLAGVTPDYYFMPRPHPNTKTQFSGEMLPWNKALASYEGRLVVDWFGQCTPASLIATCAATGGVVISMFSTMLAEAACLRAQNIAVLYPEFGMREFKRVTPWKGDYDISVPLGCATVAMNRDELIEVIHAAFGGGLYGKNSVQERFRGDGRNSERAARAVLEMSLF